MRSEVVAQYQQQLAAAQQRSEATEAQLNATLTSLAAAHAASARGQQDLKRAHEINMHAEAAVRTNSRN